MVAARVPFAASARPVVRSPRAVVGALAAMLALAQGSAARAENARETARLAYVIAANASGCPDEESFRNLVAARLGYDPFEPDGKHAAVVEISRRGGRLRAAARVTRQGQPEPGIREIEGGLDQCEALTSALATAVAIALDPVRGMQAPAPAPPPAAPDATTPPPAAPASAEALSPAAPIVTPPPPPLRSEAPPPPPPSPPLRTSFFATAGGLAAVAAAPGVTLGGALGVGLRVRAFSLETALRVETTPGSSMLPSGDRVDVMLVTMSLDPCGHLGGWFGCALLRAGAIKGRALDVIDPARKSSPFAAAGLRGGYALQIAGPVSARAAIEASFPLTRTALTIGDHPVWTAPLVTGAAELGVLVAFQ